MTSAVLSTLSVGLSCSTVEFKVNFIRPITSKTGIVRCKAKTVHAGNRIATAEGKIIDNKDKLYAHGVSTLMIFKQPK
ncbi:MAG: PaaI family thioesterase, partial [Desulfobacteraceae bacterium]